MIELRLPSNPDLGPAPGGGTQVSMSRIYPYPGAADPQAYELLNMCTDPERKLERLMWGLAPIAGKVVMDIGAGSGFHAVRFASEAAEILAVEPDRKMLDQMRARLRTSTTGNTAAVGGSADALPLRGDIVDVAQARFAYFFGTTECLPGMQEVKRVLKPGGQFFVVDTNPDRGTFGRLARRANPSTFHERYRREHIAFYREHGFSAYAVDTALRAPDRQALEQILRMEFPRLYTDFMEEIKGIELTYGLSVYHFQNPSAG